MSLVPDNTKAELFKLLSSLSIDNKTYTHERVYTVDEARAVNLPSLPCKNLFLKDSNKRFWLVVALPDTKIVLKELAKMICAPELRFADEATLMHYLGVEPGSVTPFGLINDKNHEVTVILDSDLFTAETLGFHPLSNDETTFIKPNDLKKFIQKMGNKLLEVNFHE